LFLSAKVPSPWHSGIFFLSAIVLNSLPAYYEGYLDIKNVDNEMKSTALERRMGFYSLIIGIGVLALKPRKL